MNNSTESYKEISFNINTSRVIADLNGMKGDNNSRGVYVNLIKNHVTYTPTSEQLLFYAEKPDGTITLSSAVIDNGQFRIDFPNQVFAVNGRVNCQLILRDVNDYQLSSGSFRIDIDKGSIEKTLLSKNERGIVDKVYEISEYLLPKIEETDKTININEDARTLSEISRIESEENRKEAFSGYENRIVTSEDKILNLQTDYNGIKTELVQAKDNANASALNADEKATLANTKANLADVATTEANNKMIELKDSYVDLDTQHTTVINGFSLLPSKTNQMENISALQKISDNLKVPVGGISSVLKMANETIGELDLLKVKLEQDLSTNDTLVDTLDLMITELNALNVSVTNANDVASLNETERISEEGLRIVEENKRVISEGLRVFEEQKRIDEEQSRKLAEQNRVDSFNTYDTRVSLIEQGFIDHKLEYTEYKPILEEAKIFADHSAVNANSKATLAEEKANLAVNATTQANNKMTQLEVAYEDLNTQHTTVISGFTLLPSKTNQTENILALQKISNNLKIPVSGISRVLQTANDTIDELVLLKVELEDLIAKAKANLEP